MRAEGNIPHSVRRTKATEVLVEPARVVNSFDATTDAPGYNWEYRINLGLRNGWHNYLLRAVSYVKLFPEKKGELKYLDVLFDEALAFINTTRQEATTAHQWAEIAQALEGLLWLFPERRDELQIDHSMWAAMIWSLQEEMRGNSGRPHIARNLLRGIALAFPERREEIDPQGRIWADMQSALMAAIEAKDWGGVTATAQIMVHIFPDRRDELGLDEGVWSSIKAEIRTMAEDKPLSDDVLGYSAMLAVLAADEMQITREDGVKLIHTPESSGSESLPPRQVA